jgi:hypothetical protein
VYEALREYGYELHPSDKSNRLVPFADDELERVLIARKEPLIDLGLADVSRNAETIRILYRRSRDDHYNDPFVSKAIRIACLANRLLPRADLAGRYPWQVLNGDDVSKIFEDKETDEINAIFYHGDNHRDMNLLSALYKRSPPFDVIDEDFWRYLIANSNGSIDDPDLRWPIFHLLQTAPVSRDWVLILNKLLVPTWIIATPDDEKVKQLLLRWQSAYPIDSETGIDTTVSTLW